MNRTVIIVAIAVGMACVFALPVSQARVRFGASGMLGLGGEVEVETDTPIGNISVEDDMDPTFGFGFLAETPMTDLFSVKGFGNYVSLGGEVRMLFWETDSNLDGMMLEISPYTKVRYGVADQVDLFGRFSMGLTFLMPDDDNIDTGVGLNIGLFGGAEYAISDDIEMYAELGFIYHLAYGDAGDFDYTADTTQFHLNIGVMF